MSVDYVIKPLGVLIAFVYPFYASFKALDSKSSEGNAQWLTYWCVVAILSTAEFFLSWALKWFTFYFTLKIIFLLWLQLPQSKGALLIYWRLIHPQMKKHEEKIDNAVLASRRRMLRLRDQLSSSYPLPSSTMVQRGTASAADKVLQELEEGDVGEKGE